MCSNSNKLTSKQLTRHAFRRATWSNMLCSGITFLYVVLCVCINSLTFLLRGTHTLFQSVSLHHKLTPVSLN